MTSLTVAEARAILRADEALDLTSGGERLTFAFEFAQAIDVWDGSKQRTQ